MLVHQCRKCSAESPVLDDPSRSGRATVDVSGRVRLGVELLILSSGWGAYGIAGYPVLGAGFVAPTALHYFVARERMHWLLAQPPPSIVERAER